jgi:3-mercaptopyruvate sulfurtransferase SseA
MSLRKFIACGALMAALGGLSAACSRNHEAASTAAPSPTVSALEAAASTPAPTPQSPEDRMPRVNAEEAKQLVAAGKALIIDVRSPEAYREAHIKDSVNVPLPKLEAGELKGLPRDRRIIVYCT